MSLNSSLIDFYKDYNINRLEIPLKKLKQEGRKEFAGKSQLNFYWKSANEKVLQIYVARILEQQDFLV